MHTSQRSRPTEMELLELLIWGMVLYHALRMLLPPEEDKYELVERVYRYLVIKTRNAL
jgi:hypothetical protein